MENIAVLGPKGTFTEKAAKEYMKKLAIDGKINYFPTLRKTMDAIEKSSGYGVIPIENTLDGFVQIILDLLTTTTLKIVHELVLPIQFALVSKADSIEKIEKIYAQFKSHNQCLKVLEDLSDKKIVITESNSESYEFAINGDEKVAAIVPIHLANDPRINIIKENITDSDENQTRFIVLANEKKAKIMQKEAIKSEDRSLDNIKWKTSIVVNGHNNRSGLLVDILEVFKSENINLNSIMSRPTKKELGTYNFFIDVDGSYINEENVKRAIDRACEEYDIKVLGTFYEIR